MQLKRFKYGSLYFPGLISLMGLPLLLISYVLYSGGFAKKNAMEAVWIDKDFIENNERLYPGTSFEKNLFERKYTNIDLTGDTRKDEMKNRSSG